MLPETELLCLCAVSVLPEDRRLRLGALARGDIDWARFSELAVRHRVFPLAYRSLSTAAPGAVPAAILENLRVRYYQNLTQNLAAEKELLRILEVFAEYGLAAVTYKGPLLAETAFGDLGLRQYNDLDILIREQDLELAVSSLESLGYRSDLPSSSWEQGRFRTYLRDFAFLRAGGPCPVEIQWRLAQRYHPLFRNQGRLWRSLRDEGLAGVPLKTLSSTDSLLCLCLHGLYHSWQQLQMVCDVAESIRFSGGLDWDVLLAEAREQGGLRILLLGLLLTRHLLDAALPREVLDAAAADRFISGLAAKISRDFFDRCSYLKRARSFFFLETKMIGGPWNRIRYFWGRLWTPNEQDLKVFFLPSALFVFHPLFRMVRLFKTYF